MSTNRTITYRRIIAAALAIAAVASSAFATASTGARSAFCASAQHVPGVGLACPRPDGNWGVDLGDGVERLTHGPDHLGGLPIHQDYELLATKKRKPSCVTTGNQPHIQVVYSPALDGPNRLSERLTMIRNMIGHINGMLYKESNGFDRPMVYRMRCVAGQVSILSVNVQVAKANADYVTLATALRRAGQANSYAKYWLFYDAPSPIPGVGGVSSALSDDSRAANNVNNFGPTYSVFYDTGSIGFTTMAMMHEAAHAMGAIQSSAPNSTGGFHCIDDSDVMCYPDGGPRASLFKPWVCRHLHFDCNNNDYFNPRPKKGSYLATHWNLASPLHRYVAGCAYRIGAMNAGTAGVDVDGTARGVNPDWDNVATATASIPKRCAGHAFALSGFYSPLPRQSDAVVGLVPDWQGIIGRPSPDGLLNSTVPEPDFNVCFYKGSKRLKCFTAQGTDEGSVPRGSTKARVTYNVGGPATWVLSAI